jgi:hypothetical protein
LGHQVIGLYLGPTEFFLAVHTTLSDENPNVFVPSIIPFTGTASNAQELQFSYTQLAGNDWLIKLVSNGQTKTITSADLGQTWSNQIDGFRFFTSQEGTNPGSPMEIENMAVTTAAVPEPPPWAMLGIGLLGVTFAVCRKRALFDWTCGTKSSFS